MNDISSELLLAKQDRDNAVSEKARATQRAEEAEDRLHKDLAAIQDAVGSDDQVAKLQEMITSLEAKSKADAEEVEKVTRHFQPDTEFVASHEYAFA